MPSSQSRNSPLRGVESIELLDGQQPDLLVDVLGNVAVPADEVVDERENVADVAPVHRVPSGTVAPRHRSNQAASRRPSSGGLVGVEGRLPFYCREPAKSFAPGPGIAIRHLAVPKSRLIARSQANFVLLAPVLHLRTPANPSPELARAVYNNFAISKEGENPREPRLKLRSLSRRTRPERGSMMSLITALITLASLCAGIMLGSAIRHRLPDHHLRDDSRDVIKMASGMIATLVALVIGLLVTSSKASYDQASGAVTQIGAKVIVLNRVLERYGSETKPIRNECAKGSRPALSNCGLQVEV